MSEQPRASPSFSVVIPLYQKRESIQRCLDSVRAQSFPAAEVIVIDDGSTDGGGEVARASGGGWVRYVRQDNRGVSVARNAGLALASGSYIAFLDADDSWLPGHLAELLRLARAHPQATILGTAWVERGRPVIDPTFTVDPTIVDIATYLTRAIANMPPFWTSAVAIRRESLSTPHLFPEGSRIAEDQDAWITQLMAGYGVRSLKVTAEYWVDPHNPTIAAPRLRDFDSVIFTKWSVDARFQTGLFIDFVAAHRLYTIARHAGHTPTSRLMKELLRTRTRTLWPRKLRTFARLLRASISTLDGQ